MKKYLPESISLLFIIISLLTGCGDGAGKAENLFSVYGFIAVISLFLLIGCCCLVRRKRTWFIVLFSSVLVVNTGYALLAASSCLETALMANRVAYLGSVFLPLSMLMIILNVTNTRYPKILPVILFVLAAVMFCVAASPGISDIYYKEVSFLIKNGMATLVKVYGPLHPLYLFYLLGYFSAMVAVVIRSSLRKAMDSAAHALILAIAVLVNIGVWFAEQLFQVDFEFLSMSYIISELFLLGVHLMAAENERLKALVSEKEEYLHTTVHTPEVSKANAVSAEAMESFTGGLPTLTPTEHTIYEAYLQGKTTKEIMADLNIKENTLKFHNKNLYGKLGVSSRKQLLEVYKAVYADKEH